jgi:hypothetical protein
MWKARKAKKQGFPLFPQRLEIAPRFPHFHRLDDYGLYSTTASLSELELLPMSPVQSVTHVPGGAEVRFQDASFIPTVTT